MPYQCSICQKEFKQKGHYEAHQARKRPCTNTLMTQIEQTVQEILANSNVIVMPPEPSPVDLTKKTREELIVLCKDKGIKGYSGKKRDDILYLLEQKIETAEIAEIAETAIATESSSLTFIDLFCGIGGFHQALTSLGAKCVLACDIDPKCREVYKNNYGLEPKPDVTKLDSKEIPDFDILCGGFPCQAFSHSGKQLGFEDTRGTLFRDVCRILREKKPKYFLLENVKNLKGHDGGKTWATIYKSLTDSGYTTHETPIVISPHQLGVPQHRERVMILGTRNDLVPVPPLPVPSGYLPPSIQTVLVKDSDVPKGMGLSEEDLEILDHWETFVQHFKKANIKLPTFPMWSEEWNSTYDIMALPTWKQKFILQNRLFYRDNRAFLEPWLKEARTLETFTNARSKLEWQSGAFQKTDSLWTLLFQIRPSGIRVKRANYSPALVAMSQIVYVGEKKRKLCPREVARLQSFPDTFTLPTSNSVAYKQFGNSVNVEVIKYAAKHLLKQELESS